MASGNLDIPQAAQSMGYVPFHGVDGCQRSQYGFYMMTADKMRQGKFVSVPSNGDLTAEASRPQAICPDEADICIWIFAICYFFSCNSWGHGSRPRIIDVKDSHACGRQGKRQRHHFMRQITLAPKELHV